MTKEEAIEEVCSIISMAYQSIGNFTTPSDGFCGKCGGHQGRNWNFQNAGLGIMYVRQAVLDQLKRDGHDINEGWDPETGIECSE